MKLSENMAESEGTKEIMSQAAIQVASAVMMAFRDTDTGPQQPPQQAAETKVWQTNT